ncbi:hypothetical protein NKR23_g8672 [Pleurostoma richardsiae]|uniref:PEBP-like protein n=1 Tax=Pleurostoma richardsiae TaxID=41990 RepID=A0AA38R7B0_9PEZI|nr:hypothetical protein NKR23_g8672 [Pleurostoma richardsiae]
MLSSELVPAGLALIEKDKSKVLGLTVGSQKVEPGLYIPRADAKAAPELHFDGASASATYICVNLDLDAPFISFSVLGPVLHWLQSGFRATAGSTLHASEPVIAKYAGPRPPPGAAPHRYVFFLYEQPAGFDVKKYVPADGQEMGVSKRMRWNFDAWAKEVGLGEVVAVNYFTSN